MLALLPLREQGLGLTNTLAFVLPGGSARRCGLCQARGSGVPAARAESEGQGQEGSAALQEGAAGAAELGVPPSSHRELCPAVVVREGDTAGGESSSRPGVEGALVRDVEVPAAGGFGAFQDTNSLRSTFGSACVQQSAAAGDTGESVTATDQSIQGRSGGECGTAEGLCPLFCLAVVAGGAHRSRRN
ncbi:unnamed protein product [Ectocarpus sp. CCAP 1310/34]|nr:unnamed protein product [Ectocarpus sp. CCAP 1310/34]